MEERKIKEFFENLNPILNLNQKLNFSYFKKYTSLVKEGTSETLETGHVFFIQELTKELFEHASKLLSSDKSSRSEAIEKLILFIKELVRVRFESLLIFTPVPEGSGVHGEPKIHQYSLYCLPWREIATGFFTFSIDALDAGFISQQQFDEFIPYQIDEKTEKKHLLIREFFFPGLYQRFIKATEGFIFGNGLFSWSKVESDDPPQPRLFTSAERFLLKMLEWKEDTDTFTVPGSEPETRFKYWDFFVTEIHTELPISEQTFRKLKQYTIDALLLPFTLTIDAYPERVRKIIRDKEAEDRNFQHYPLDQKNRFALTFLHDEIMEEYTAAFLASYYDKAGWLSDKVERFICDNQVIRLAQTAMDDRIIKCTTLARVFYDMSNQVCAQALWGRLLWLLVDYEPQIQLDPRIENKYQIILATARRHSRARKFSSRDSSHLKDCTSGVTTPGDEHSDNEGSAKKECSANSARKSAMRSYSDSNLLFLATGRLSPIRPSFVLPGHEESNATQIQEESEDMMSSNRI